MTTMIEIPNTVMDIDISSILDRAPFKLGDPAEWIEDVAATYGEPIPATDSEYSEYCEERDNVEQVEQVASW